MKYSLLLASLLLLGCSSDSDKEDKDSVLLDAARSPLDKAEAVEDVVLESKDKLDDAIEEAED